MARKILVLGEVRDGSLEMYHSRRLVLERLDSEGGEVVGVLIGENVPALGSQLIQYGADRVVVVEDPQLAQYTTDGYAQALLTVIEAETCRRSHYWTYFTR